MSRIAKYPVAVPDKVEVTVDKSEVTVKGPLGTLKQAISPDVVVKLEGGRSPSSPPTSRSSANAMSGTLRATRRQHGPRREARASRRSSRSWAWATRRRRRATS